MPIYGKFKKMETMEGKEETLCYHSKLTVVNIYSQFKPVIYLLFSICSLTRSYGEWKGTLKGCGVSGRGPTITQVTGVRDVRAKCDKSCNRVEEKEIHSSLGIWEGFMDTVHLGCTCKAMQDCGKLRWGGAQECSLQWRQLHAHGTGGNTMWLKPKMLEGEE